MTLYSALALFMAALVGGGINSVAGGGSFFTFPVLIFTGIAPIAANATSTVALWPGSVASIAPYRDALSTQRQTLLSLIGISLAGGILGAIVLLNTPQSTFKMILPFLLLFATLLFTFGSTITTKIRATMTKNQYGMGWYTMFVLPVMQFIVALYGGYFGGGIGIIMLALFSLMEMKDIHTMNALKVILGSSINGVAVLIFIISGIIHWPQALVMIVGAIIGGYGGASLARKIDPRYIRSFVILTGFSLTLYFFLQYF